MIKTNVDYQDHDCTNKMHNQPEMLDSPSCSVELSELITKMSKYSEGTRLFSPIMLFV